MVSELINEIKKRYFSIGRVILVYGSAVNPRLLLADPYFHLAFVVTMFCYPIWKEPNWWNSVVAVIPNILGYSLGGFAVYLSIGSDKFKKLMSGSATSKPSPLVGFSCVFAHMIFIQLLALFLALIASARIFSALGIKISELQYLTRVFWFFGFLSFSYSLALVGAACISLLRLVIRLDDFLRLEEEKEAKQDTRF